MKRVVNRIAPYVNGAKSNDCAVVEDQKAVTPDLEEDDGDNYDDDDYDDDDDDDGDDPAFDQKIAIAGSPHSVLSEARITFIRHPKRPGKLLMVAQIEDVLPEAEDDDEGDEEEGFKTDGTEMFEGDLVIHLGTGYALPKKKLDPRNINPNFFKTKNFRAQLHTWHENEDED